MEERKVFEDGNVTVTTDRIVIGGSVWPLGQVQRAVKVFDDNWKGALIFIGIGVACFSFGAPLWGVGLVAAGILFWVYVKNDRLLIVTGEGVYDTVNISGGRARIRKVESAINSVIAMKEGAASSALHDELRNMKGIGEE